MSSIELMRAAVQGVAAPNTATRGALLEAIDELERSREKIFELENALAESRADVQALTEQLAAQQRERAWSDASWRYDKSGG